MKVLQINATVNSGSTGRIAEDIGKVLIQNGHESYIAYGRGNSTSVSKLLKIGSQFDVYSHGLKTLLTDRHGFGSKKATLKLIEQIKEIKPDVVGLHNLHGYYINIEILFNFLAISNIPVLWTLFDCWAFTGHCTYFDDINCNKWQTHCEKCPKYKNYPSSWIDNSFKNFDDKRELFLKIPNLEIVTHSNWLCGLVKKSYLKHFQVHVTPSAINLNLFKQTLSMLQQQYGFGNKKILLGCASIWSNRKGYDDFLQLNEIIDKVAYQIVLIGLNDNEIGNLPSNIIGIKRTESTQELAQWYSIAEVFINPTSQDNFPTTNLESLACGTPVITYNTGGSAESIDEETGVVVEKGNVDGLLKAIEIISKKNKTILSANCRKRAELLYNDETRFMDYLNIFKSLAQK